MLLFLLFVILFILNKNIIIAEGLQTVITIPATYCSGMNQNDCNNKWKTQATYSKYMNPCAWMNNSCSNNSAATKYYTFS